MTRASAPIPRIEFLKSEDFEFVAQFFIRTAGNLKNKMNQAASIEAEVAVGRQAFYLHRYLEDMVHFGWLAITKEMEKRFEQEYGDAHMLRTLACQAAGAAADAWHGQYQLGENNYILQDGIVYYRTLFGRWHTVDLGEVFLLLPQLGLAIAPDSELYSALEATYQPTRLDHLFRLWKDSKGPGAIVPEVLLLLQGTTTPEAYSRLVQKQLQAILQTPPALSAVVALCPADAEIMIEKILKISWQLIRFVDEIRSKNVFPVYILRDGMMFAEAQAALNWLEGEEKPWGEVMIGRKLLSTASDPEYFWRLIVDVLYQALKKYPDNFTAFSKEYEIQMSRQVEAHPELVALFDRLRAYLQSQVTKAGSTEVLIVDTGLQGSVNMLIKYLLDSAPKPSSPSVSGSPPTADIFMFIVGEWFKGVYRGRYASDYYPMMRDIEVLSRSEYVYSYRPGSFERGKLEVEMGSTADQMAANIELICLAVLCQLYCIDKRTA